MKTQENLSASPAPKGTVNHTGEQNPPSISTATTGGAFIGLRCKMANVQTENGHVRLANNYFEELSKTDLSGREFRVLFVIIRKTWGFLKKEEIITLQEIKNRTGISKDHCCRTIKRLIERGMISIAENGNGQIHKYRAVKDFEKWKALPKMATPLPKMAIAENGNGHCRKRQRFMPKMATVHAENGNGFYPPLINPPINELKQHLKQPLKQLFKTTIESEYINIDIPDNINEPKTYNDCAEDDSNFDRNFFEEICDFTGTTSATIPILKETHLKAILKNYAEPELRLAMEWIKEDCPWLKNLPTLERYAHPEQRVKAPKDKFKKTTITPERQAAINAARQKAMKEALED